MGGGALHFLNAGVCAFSAGVNSGVGGGADGGETVEADGVDEACFVVDAAGEMLVLIVLLEPGLPVHTALSGWCQV